MTQNNVNIQQTLTTEQWEATKSSPLPVNGHSDVTLRPTVSDELRWSLQTAVRPLESAAQMAAGVHGITTKDPVAVQQLVIAAQQQFTNATTLASKTNVQQVALQSQAIFQSINRINSITLEQMGFAALRMCISDMASIHPSVLQYMRDNDSTFTYFKPVSESIGLMYMIVADIACAELANWANVDVFQSPASNSAGAVRAATFNKLFPEIGTTVEVANALTNAYAMRAMPRNSASKITGSGGGGLNNAIDTSWQHIIKSKPAIYAHIASELSGQLALLDQLVPVSSNVFIENKLYNMPINGFVTFVDQLGEKLFNKERSTDVLIPYDDQVIKETLR